MIVGPCRVGPLQQRYTEKTAVVRLPCTTDCLTSNGVWCRSANVSTTFDTAAFRPPRSLALVALKLYFAPHKDQRRLIDSKYYWETQQVDQAAADMGITTANGQMSFAQVAVSAEEASSILQQLLQELVRLSGRYFLFCFHLPCIAYCKQYNCRVCFFVCPVNAAHAAGCTPKASNLSTATSDLGTMQPGSLTLACQYI